MLQLVSVQRWAKEWSLGCLLTPSGREAQVHATKGPLFGPALYTKQAWHTWMVVANATRTNDVLISEMDLVLLSRREDVIFNWSCSRMHLCFYIIDIAKTRHIYGTLVQQLLWFPSSNSITHFPWPQNVCFFPERGKWQFSWKICIICKWFRLSRKPQMGSFVACSVLGRL